MERFLKERAFQADYHEQLADERAKTERALLLKVLARKEAENRQRAGSARRDRRGAMNRPRTGKSFVVTLPRGRGPLLSFQRCIGCGQRWSLK
jgi:hypothetical protein